MELFFIVSMTLGIGFGMFYVLQNPEKVSHIYFSGLA